MRTIIICMVFAPISALAQYVYDANSGNSYQQYGNTVYGSNAQNGTRWSQSRYGNTVYGQDAQGNYYNYNTQTGNYMNSNGKVCFGTGAFRRCN